MDQFKTIWTKMKAKKEAEEEEEVEPMETENEVSTSNTNGTTTPAPPTHFGPIVVRHSQLAPKHLSLIHI